MSTGMTFRCAKCQGEVPVPEDLIHDSDGVTVRCPSCGARYRKRKKRPPNSPADVAAAPQQNPDTPSEQFTGTVGSGDLSSAEALSKGRTTPLPAAGTLPPISDSGAGTSVPSEAAALPSSAGDVQPTQPSWTGAMPPGAYPNSPPPAAPTAPAAPTSPPRSSQTPAATFYPDELVSGRYRILRFIAKGGMGEVYEAHDLELDERVALKTIRSHAATDQGALERFKREIQLARKVTHPNVCRIFDVGFHRYSPEAGERDLTFLTMEFLEGDTLARRIKNEGPMTTSQALETVVQMAEALHAAHRAGIVHRDFKSDNVMLVPSADGVRVVVTDFGIARVASQEEKDAVRVTSKGDIVGTPAYMAPEQVEGGSITGAADQYALGIVMFEMLTGKVPFLEDSPLATAAKRLTEPPPSPRLHAPDIDADWEEVILRCLERRPQDRFPDTIVVARTLSHEDQPTEEQLQAFEQEKQLAVVEERERTLRVEREKGLEEEVKRARSHRFRLILATLLVIASGLLLYTRIIQSLKDTSPLSGFPTGPIEARRAVAILGFNNVSGRPEAAWLSTALAEMIGTELASGGQLRIIPGENVARMKVELKLAEVDSLANDTLQLIGANLGTDYVVLGSYTSLPAGSLRLDLRLQDAQEGGTLAAAAENGRESELFDLVARAGKGLREHLDVEAPKSRAAVSALPTDPQAAKLYAEGLDKLREFDPLAARDLFEQAAEVEPRNAMIYSAQATALLALGYQDLGLEAARKAYDLSSQLPDEERLTVEGQYREAAQQWPRAARIYETLWAAYPDNLEYGLRLVAALNSADRPQQALATVDLLRRLPAPAADDPRVDLAEASASSALSQFRRQQSAAERAADHARTLNAVLLVAQARVTEAEALRHLGRLDEARDALQEAEEIYVETANRAGQALTLVERANVLFSAGDYPGAIDLYQASLNIYNESGDQSGVLRALNNIAVVLRNQGELEAAEERYLELLSVSKEVGSKIAEASALNNLGAAQFAAGKLEQAKRRFEDALRLNQQIGQKSGEAAALGNIAVVMRDLGALDEAKSLHQQSLEIRRDIGHVPGEIASLNHLGTLALDEGELDAAQRSFEQARVLADSIGGQSLVADALYGLAHVARARGRSAEARTALERSLEIRQALGERAAVSKAQLALIFLMLESEGPDQAERAARTLAVQFQAAGAIDEEALANVALSRIHLDQGRLPQARQAIDRARQLVSHSERKILRLRVDRQHGAVLRKEGAYEDADRVLQASLTEATAAGLVELELETRLEVGMLAAARGDTDTARGQLEDLGKAARERGYATLALRATGAIPR